MFLGTLAHAFWAPGTEIVYDYNADLETSTKFPDESTSQWTLKGKLVVQGDQNAATLQVSNLCLD